MASGTEAEKVVTTHDLLEWPQKDKRRFLHAVYRVGDLERTIKFVFIEKMNFFFLGFTFAS